MNNMYCDLCGRINGHLPGCPNDKEAETTYRCSICDNGIYEGEEYIQNNFGEYAHYDCITGIRHLLEWLGTEVKEMEK